MGRPRDDEKRNLIRQLKSTGLSFKTIADRLGISRQAASQMLKADICRVGNCQKCGRHSDSLHCHHTDYAANKTRLLCLSCHSKEFNISANRMAADSHLVQMETGALMRKKRIEAKMTQRELASKLKISSMYISDLERGKRNWSETLISKINQMLK